MYDIRKNIFALSLAFIFGAVSAALVTGYAGHLRESGRIGELDRRYALAERDSAHTIGSLKQNLERERTNNRFQREASERAREIVRGLTETAEFNVRNLHEAVGLIREIRTQLRFLEEIYLDRPSGNSLN
ncbi:hypothetical protein FACS189447_01550 [Spirochaetia bacterium]|nr:hypothetical protein FACS189447_01550 [Spirochaetia bacterium]